MRPVDSYHRGRYSALSAKEHIGPAQDDSNTNPYGFCSDR
jgi:hypothetical protein